MTADAFRRRQREGPHRFTQNRPRSFVAALQDVTAEEKSKTQLSRDFWCCPIFDFCNLLSHRHVFPSTSILARISDFSTLPTLERGRSSQTSICLGVLTLPTRCFTKADSAATSTVRPALGCTTATTRSPHFSSGKPMTAQS